MGKQAIRRGMSELEENDEIKAWMVRPGVDGKWEGLFIEKGLVGVEADVGPALCRPNDIRGLGRNPKK